MTGGWRSLKILSEQDCIGLVEWWGNRGVPFDSCSARFCVALGARDSCTTDLQTTTSIKFLLSVTFQRTITRVLTGVSSFYTLLVTPHSNLVVQGPINFSSTQRSLQITIEVSSNIPIPLLEDVDKDTRTVHDDLESPVKELNIF